MNNTKLFGAYCALVAFMVGITRGSTLQQYFDRKEAIIAGVEDTLNTSKQKKQFLYTLPNHYKE